MNLHAIVSPSIAAINPMIIGSVAVSTGDTVDANYKPVPGYTIVTGIPMQVQALDGWQLQHVESLNLQGTVRAVYLNGAIEGLNRFAGKGGDLLKFADPITAITDYWLVEHVIEPWNSAGWCKVVCTLQTDKGPF